MSNAPPRRSKAPLIRLAGAWLVCLATSGAVAGDGPLQACRAIAADAARLACYDRLAERPATPSAAPPAGAEPPGTVSTAPLATAGAAAPASSPAPSPEELFGRDAAQSEDLVRRAAGIGRVEAITGRVVALERDPFGKVIVTLDNGQVWSQIDSPPARLRTGDAVRIRRGALNSYLLNLAEGGHASRVRRSR